MHELSILNERLTARCLERLDALEQGDQAAALLGDLDALSDLPAVPFEACEHMPGQVSPVALVRYRLVDYSAPAVHAHKKVTIKGYVDRVEIALGAEIVARHRRSYVRGDVVYDPLHYLSLLEKKPGALDQAVPLRGWKLDPAVDRRLTWQRRLNREWLSLQRLPNDLGAPTRPIGELQRCPIEYSTASIWMPGCTGQSRNIDKVHRGRPLGSRHIERLGVCPRPAAGKAAP